jgi:hypothetical protein
MLQALALVFSTWMPSVVASPAAFITNSSSGSVRVLLRATWEGVAIQASSNHLQVMNRGVVRTGNTDLRYYQNYMSLRRITSEVTKFCLRVYQ